MDYTTIPAGDWTPEQQQAAVEHAIEITTNYTKSSLKATGGHAMPLAIVLCKQSIALMNQAGWTSHQILQFCEETTRAVCYKERAGVITMPMEFGSPVALDNLPFVANNAQ